MLNRSLSPLRQRGLSLVELLVGIAVGMFVVAAAATLVVTQLTDNRRMLLEVQVQQDLRATADIITRELRRAGSIAFLGDATSYVWAPGSDWVPNPYVAVNPVAAAADTVTFSSSRTLGSSGPYGFRLVDGAIESQLAAAGWQQLTDAATMRVTAFSITPQPQPPIRISCSKLCADGTQNCWPTVTVRAYTIDITGQATSDAAVRRSIRSVARLRNDQVTTDPGLGARSCPA
jgi:Prokaryotic N-terminal methylation motif